MWRINTQFISDANKLGSQFVIVSEKVVNFSMWLWEEIKYLIENGIPCETLI